MVWRYNVTHVWYVELAQQWIRGLSEVWMVIRIELVGWAWHRNGEKQKVKWKLEATEMLSFESRLTPRFSQWESSHKCKEKRFGIIFNASNTRHIKFDSIHDDDLRLRFHKNSFLSCTRIISSDYLFYKWTEAIIIGLLDIYGWISIFEHWKVHSTCISINNNKILISDSPDRQSFHSLCT